MWRIRLLVLLGWLFLQSAAWAQMSPLNLAPGFPTQLDDAYPINGGAAAFQPAVRFDKTEHGEGRLRQTIDVRYGVGPGTEVFVGGTTIRGPLLPGTMDDPRAIRAGLLHRLTKQPGADALLPSLAVRTTVQVPVSGPERQPAIRAELLASWDLGSGWWWHMNAGYQVVPGHQPGLQSPGRTSVWYGRGGIVKSLGYNLGLVINATYSQDYTTVGGNLLTPEIGLAYGLTEDWILTGGVGRDFGPSDSRSTVRANIGISWVW